MSNLKSPLVDNSKEEKNVMRVYLVKEGDSLWSIAQNELGDGARWREIRDIHGNPYSEGTTIHPGWQIQLPN